MLLHDGDKFLEPASDFVVNLYMDMVDPSGGIGLHWDVDIVAVNDGSDPQNRVIGLYVLPGHYIDPLYGSGPYHVLVGNRAVPIGIITIEIWVFIGIASVVGVNPTLELPPIRHAVLVCIGIKWVGEVGWPPVVRNGEFLDVVQSVSIVVAICVGRVGRVQEPIVVRVEGIAEFESVGHTIPVRIPVPRTIQPAIPIHILIEPVRIIQGVLLLKGGLNSSVW